MQQSEHRLHEAPRRTTGATVVKLLIALILTLAACGGTSSSDDATTGAIEATIFAQLTWEQLDNRTQEIMCDKYHDLSTRELRQMLADAIPDKPGYVTGMTNVLEMEC